MFGGAPTVAALSLLSMGASNVMLSNGELRGAKMAVAFTSANNRRYWQSAFLSSLLWIVAAIAIGFAVGRDGGNPWLVAAFAYGAFIALSILWWISRAIVGWLVWRVIWKRSAINDLVAAFEKSKLPKPSANMDSPRHILRMSLKKRPLSLRLE
jgi:hypothetical protein